MVPWYRVSLVFQVKANLELELEMCSDITIRILCIPMELNFAVLMASGISMATCHIWTLDLVEMKHLWALMVNG